MFIPTGKEKRESNWGILDIPRDVWQKLVARADARVKRSMDSQRARPIITNWKEVRQGAPPRFVK